MLESENRAQLPLTSSVAGCSCCSSEPFLATVTDAVELAVEGMTCGHCVQTVEKAVSGLEDVDSVAVDLVPGGRSRLLVDGRADLAAVRQAVISAGYKISAN